MRKIIPFNEHWNFTKDTDPGTAKWEAVSLPHTWNAVDGMDGKGSYFRGLCWYSKEFEAPSFKEGERVCLEIAALSLSGKVFVNGKELACHKGGFSSFVTDITRALKKNGKNQLLIAADNRNQTDVYPQMADFTFYGGLYRGVNLLILPPVHFEVSYYGAQGLAITSEPLFNGASPSSPLPPCCDSMLHLNSWVANPSEDYTVRYVISGKDGSIVSEIWRPSLSPKADVLLPEAHLWQGIRDPYLYTCSASLVYRNETVDLVESSFGIRSFHVDPDKGFFLNGRPMMLRGVSRHQDRLYKGNALTREEHYQDAALIQEIGANTVRLAHYQHSRDFYDACDEYGFIVWAEIPYISSQSDDPAAHENCRQQMKELIYQNYNHPCICFWGLSNEITITGEKPGLAENHRDLNKLVKSIDPSRLTTMAHVSMLPADSVLHGITDLESYNHYFGWYGGTYDMNEKWLDDFHMHHPDLCLGLSEYGAEGIITYQPDEPKCRDYSEAYQAEYHEHMAKILMERPYLWATHVWNMFDFGCAARNEGGVAGRNNKGLVTMDRLIKKDAFYLYKAYWSQSPFVHICGQRYAQRAGDFTSVKVYSNCPCVTLYVNGQPFASLSGNKIFLFEGIPLKEGFTFLTARAEDCCSSHSLTLERVSDKPSIYTLPQEDDDDLNGVANWFEQTESLPKDAPTERSDKRFSIYDKLTELLENEETFQILAGSLYAMTGMRIKKSMLSMMGEKTLAELSDMMTGMSSAKSSPSGEKIPENAMEIINARLGGILKK